MLEVRSLSVGYGLRPVLHQVSFRVPKGELLALIGPNGAGKSTLLRTISGVLRPSEGEVRVEGRDVMRLSTAQRARLMAVVPQARQLPEGFTVWQTVLLGRTPYLGWLGRSAQHDHQRVQEALRLTDTLHLSKRPIGQLSGGEQQRVLLARALAQDTPILLLDEPTAHLDLHHQVALLNLITELTHSQALAVVMALHDLNLASMYADRVALLDDGVLRAWGKPAEVLTVPRLSEVYRIPLQAVAHPHLHIPLILPDGQPKSVPAP